MDVISCLYFVEAAKDLNFTKTAKRLYISQQTLSNHIARLEDEYNVKFFHRKPCLKLTYAGEIFLKFAESGILNEENLRRQLMQIGEQTAGSLNIGCSPSRSSIIVVDILDTFFEKYPNVQVNLYHHHSPLLSEMALKGELDFSVSIPQRYRSTLSVNVIFEDTTLLVVSDELLRKYHPDDYEETVEKWSNGVTVEDFASLPLMVVRGSKLVDRMFRMSNLTPNLLISANYPQLTTAGLYERHAASILSRENYQHVKKRVQMDLNGFPILINGTPVHHTVGIIRNKRKYLPPYGEYFIELIKEKYRTIE